ncbi:MAG TPA: VWA domain-containing protein [Pyrinomonadaceae bacterium]|nr:VWA domain-containing protein [Pyrinomonadaceae bacterium]
MDKITFFVKCLGLILVSALCNLAQTPTPTPIPPDEPIKVFTEEIHLNVSAQTSNDKFVPNLKADDLLIVEEGTPQTITSMKKVPANVLLLLDTGTELNFVKRNSMTRVLAKLFIYSLLPDDTLSVMQYYDKIETISDWTKDFQSAISQLDKKMFSGKRSRFSQALNASIKSFESRPLENRHLVLITDGLDNVSDEAERQKALQNLVAANITVHVLSYTQLEQESAKKASRRLKLGDGKTKDRIPDEVLESILQTIPEVPDKVSIRETMRSMYKSQGIVLFDLDNERRKLIQKKEEAWHQSQEKLQSLAEDTGGIFQAPEETETMLKLAGRIANAIDSTYVVTYLPTKPVVDSQEIQSRKVRVSSHCDGVEIRSRQKIVLNSKLP